MNLHILHSRMHCAKLLAEPFWSRGVLDFVNVFSLFCNYLSLWKRTGPFIWTNLIPFTQGCFLPSLLEICPAVREKRIFKFCQKYFRYSFIVSPWKNKALHLNKLDHPRMHCAKFGWNWFSRSGKEEFVISSMCFRFIVIFSSWKKTKPFIWINLNPLYQRMLCAKFGWNWPSGSGEEDENVKVRLRWA